MKKTSKEYARKLIKDEYEKAGIGNCYLRTGNGELLYSQKFVEKIIVKAISENNVEELIEALTLAKEALQMHQKNLDKTLLGQVINKALK